MHPIVIAAVLFALALARAVRSARRSCVVHRPRLLELVERTAEGDARQSRDRLRDQLGSRWVDIAGLGSDIAKLRARTREHERDLAGRMSDRLRTYD